MQQELSFQYFKQKIKKTNTNNLPVIKISLLGDHATQFLSTAIIGQGLENNWKIDLFEADYNQIERQIFDHSSELYQHNSEFIIISKSVLKLRNNFYKLSLDEKSKFADMQIELIEELYTSISSKISAKIIISNFQEIQDGIFGNYSSKVDVSFSYQLKKLNYKLMDLSQKLKNLFVLDLASILGELGYRNSFDAKMHINADMIYSIDVLPRISKNIIDIINAVKGKFKKCLILDLDNTLWGGVIGDDGVEKIEIGDLGIGKAFTEFQLWIKQLKQRGIILAVCSKNDEKIAKTPFEQHPDMILSLEDIAIFVANWGTKVDNINYIQSILNIGFDSMVFVDDNPFERTIVRENIKDITVPEMPEDPAEYLEFIISQNLFETVSYSENDEKRTKQYQEESKRSTVRKSFSNEKEFLKNLNMTSKVDSFNEYTIPRVSQLTQRSNQFNLRTIRYTEQEIKDIKDSADYLTLSFTLNDKFGEYGLISLIIIKMIDNKTAFIDTWIMSCRVLKRGMEKFVLNQIVERLKEKGMNFLRGEYIPTPKNELVKNHYNSLGFKKEPGKNGYWILDINKFNNLETLIKRE